MSKQNRRSSGSFRTLGQRMLSFGRGIMRTYANETSLQPDTTPQAPRVQGQWRSMTTDNLIWRQEQPATSTPPPTQPMPSTDYGDDYDESDYVNYDDMGQPIQRQPQQRPRQPVQRTPSQQSSPQPQNSTPSYIQTKDGTAVRTSQNKFPDPIQRRLNAIAAAHEAKNAERDHQRDQKIENIQRKVEKGEMTTRRRRGSIEVDYVQTESLLPLEDRGKEPSTPIQTQRQETTDSGGDTADTPDANVDHEGMDEANWFDEIPDDDADIDSIAGFESSDDAVQRMPDDLPQFDMPSLNEEENPDDMGEFEGGYDDVSSQSAPAHDVVNRDYDAVDGDEASDADFDDDSPAGADANDSPIQRMAQDYTLPTFDDFDNDETVPLIPYVDSPDVGSPSPPANTPVQRVADDDLDEDAPATDYFSAGGLPANETPVQRDTIQRTEVDDSPSYTEFGADVDDAGDESATDFFSAGGTPANEAPVQRDTIQRTEIDDSPSYTEFGADEDDAGDESATDFFSAGGSPANEAPVQRDTIQRTDIDDSPPYTQFGTDDSDGDAPDTDFFSAGGLPANETPVQRDMIQRTDIDDSPSYTEFGADDEDTPTMDFSGEDGVSPNDVPLQRAPLADESYDNDVYDDDSFADVSDVDGQPSNETPVQRDYDNDDYPDFTDTSDVEASPMQREMTEYSDPVEDDDYSDYGDATWAEMNDYSPASDAGHSTSVQRDALDQPDYDDDFGDMPDVGGQAVDSSVQREFIQRDVLDQPEDDDDADDDMTGMDFDSGDALSIQPPAVQRSEMDERTFDIIDHAESLGIDSATDQPSVQRSEIEEPQADYDAYGDQTWAEMNDYAPATDSPTSPDTPIQRDLDDTAPYTPYVEADDDYLDDVDGSSAMNILNDHLAEQAGQDAGSETSGGDSPSIQRRHDDETYDYLPEDFDPTPTFYDFNQQADTPVDSPSGQDTPIQRSVDDEMGQSEPPAEQPIDLFQALSQAGVIDTPPQSPPSTASPSIQRDYQDDGDDDYGDYGDATWAEVHNYSPATDNVQHGDAPIQRTPADDFDADEPMDLFQAMSQAGMIDTPPSSPDTSDASIQRDFQADDDNNEMMDLYNAMMQAGMIQDSSKADSPSSTSDPIQRSAQPESSNSSDNLVEALMRASQVSESSSANNNASNDTASSDHAVHNVMPQNVVQRVIEEPTALTDNVTSPSINMDDKDDDTSEEDKEYLTQLARDVFRVIKRRLREEKERRG